MLPVQEAPVPSEEAVESEEESGPEGAYDFVLEYDGYFGGGMWAASDIEEEPLELLGDHVAADDGVVPAASRGGNGGGDDSDTPDEGDVDLEDPLSPPATAPAP